jgi:hypothetical protein
LLNEVRESSKCSQLKKSNYKNGLTSLRENGNNFTTRTRTHSERLNLLNIKTSGCHGNGNLELFLQFLLLFIQWKINTVGASAESEK